jgi:adenine phosphoribosyltransferase
LLVGGRGTILAGFKLIEHFKRLFETKEAPGIDELAQFVEDVPDFPQEGVLFRDISPLTMEKWPETVQAMNALFTDKELADVDAFVGLESRGFKFAGALAAINGKGMIMARKAGKLPDPLFSESYDLEYGSAEIEMKPGKGQKVIIIDDVLATGGTLRAAADLCQKAGYDVIGFGTLINLAHLNEFSWNGMKNRTVLTYNENGYVPVAKIPPSQQGFPAPKL